MCSSWAMRVQHQTPKTYDPIWRCRAYLFFTVSKINALIVYRLLAKPPDCDPFFHSALEAEQLCAVTTRPACPCARGVGGADNVTGQAPPAFAVLYNWKPQQRGGKCPSCIHNGECSQPLWHKLPGVVYLKMASPGNGQQTQIS